MQLVLSNNRVIAHGENFLSMGGVVINTVTGDKYENATVAECEGCPSDIDKVGYEYHAGVFVPCAPYGKGNNNGYFMEVCSTCATPRSSGIPIKGGLGRENLNMFPLLWENSAPDATFTSANITLERSKYIGFVIIVADSRSDLDKTQGTIIGACPNDSATFYVKASTNYDCERTITVSVDGIEISEAESGILSRGSYLIPLKIYGIKFQ